MSMPRAVRHINEVRVLDVVRRHKKISRANIARELAMTRSTASSIVASLASDGFVIEDMSEEDKSAGTGRPGTFVRLNASHSLFVGVDIAVGRISVVALDLEAKAVANAACAFGEDETEPDTVLGKVASTVQQVIAGLGAQYNLRGLCLTVPGVIDRGGTLLRAPFLGWRNIQVLDKLKALLPEIPALICENDANAFAVAHAHVVDSQIDDTEVYLFLDAGVGGAIMNRGHLLRGQDGFAGEFGHIVIGDQGFVSLKSPPGSLESFIGRDAILARIEHYGGDAKDLSDVVDGVQARVRPILLAMEDWSFYVGRGLALICSIFNPTRIVLGGPVSALFEHCRDSVLAQTRSNLFSDHPLPQIVTSDLTFDGPATGGALILHQQMFSVDEELVFRGSPLGTS